MNYTLVFSWLALLVCCLLAWYALFEYVFMPTLHALGGVFRMAVFR